MRVYHGSDREVKAPDVWHSRKEVDFGAGFYVTPLMDRAENWARRFTRQGKPGVVSEYILRDEAFEDCRVLRFEDYSEQWLDFVTSCRRGQDRTDYDIVIGGVANDRVFDTVELYFQNLIGRFEAIGRLRYEKPNLQICIRRQEVIGRYVEFERSMRI